MIKMRELFMSVTNQDLFRSITMPSACMKFFQSLLKRNHLALTPHLGYESHGKQSKLARKFLKVFFILISFNKIIQWYALWKKVKVHTVDSEQGEIKYNAPYLTPEGFIKYREYFLDGFIETPEDEKDIAIEVNGWVKKIIIIIKL